MGSDPADGDTPIYRQLAAEKLFDPRPDPAAAAPPPADPGPPPLVRLPERPDGWCENRPPEQLSEKDGWD